MSLNFEYIRTYNTVIGHNIKLIIYFIQYFK